jgi:flagellar FliJ protein
MPAHSLAALRLLQECATEERDRLVVELRRNEAAAQHARNQGAQLDRYRGEYQQRWGGQFGHGEAIEIVRCYQSFMQRLDEATEQQRQQTAAAERGAAAVRQALLQAELRAASIRKLIERRDAQARQAQERREQRETDETALGLSLRLRPLRDTPAL